MKRTDSVGFRVLLQTVPLSVAVLSLIATGGWAETMGRVDGRARSQPDLLATEPGVPALVVETAPTPQPSASPPTSTASPTPEPSPSPTASPTPEASPSPATTPTPSPSPTSPTEGTTETPPTPEPSPTPEAGETDAEPKAEEEKPPSPEEMARQQKLAEADRLYLAGDKAAAEQLYREAKPPFEPTAATADPAAPRPEPITELEQLPSPGRVFWREAQAGIEANLDTRIMVPLKLLVERYPQFVPGQIKLAEILAAKDKPDEAVTILEQATARYPNQPDLLRAKIALFAKAERWMDAAIAARQFAVLNPEHPLASEFTALADTNMQRYQKDLRSRLTGNLIGNLVTGALGYALTGNLFGPFSAIQSTTLLLRGEQGIGERYAARAKRTLPLVDDPEVLAYVNEIGEKLVKVAGRNDLKYEFFVILDDKLNAFALPGGKVFINAGAIAKTRSEAELAGLLSHELSHTILSHGFQLVTQGNLIASVVQYVPYAGGLATNLIVFNYSRDMERQADVLGTRLLASAGYAADGMRNLMVTLQQEDREFVPPAFLSTHPLTNERVRYLEQLIRDNGYNRYAFEGVERHAAIQAKVKPLIQAHQEAEEKKRQQQRRPVEPLLFNW